LLRRDALFMSASSSMENDAAQLRQRAHDARRDARDAVDPEARKTLLEIADAYERLATLAQARLAAKHATV
jgi:hypothetical protein